jgi:hypothetical protein
MVASVLPSLPRTASSCRRPSRRSAPLRRLARPPRQRQALRPDALIPAATAALLAMAAVVVAPERPQDQEAICQRHNGVEACRVW